MIWMLEEKEVGEREGGREGGGVITSRTSGRDYFCKEIRRATRLSSPKHDIIDGDDASAGGMRWWVWGRGGGGGRKRIFKHARLPSISHEQIKINCHQQNNKRKSDVNCAGRRRPDGAKSNESTFDAFSRQQSV